MTSITIRTGTNRPPKPDHPVTGDVEVEISASSTDKSIETTNVNPTESLQIESETFQNLPEKLSHDKESTERNNCDLNDAVPANDTTLLARFLPKESAEKENASLSNVDKSIKTQELQKQEQDLVSSKITNDHATTSKSTEASELLVLDPGKTSAPETQNTDDAEMGDGGVATVLGTGHSPENDPDHSMLKFAVFEVQDLTEELKKLRDLLDTLTFSEGFEQSVLQEGSDDPVRQPIEDIIVPVVFSGNSTADRADIRQGSPCETIHEIVATTTSSSTSESSPVSDAIANGRFKSLSVDCKTQSESSSSSTSSYCSAFKSCDVSGYSEERCCFMSFSQEILTAVK